MSDPCWQPVPYLLPGSFSYSTPQTFVFSGGLGQVFCPALFKAGVPAYAELQCTTGGFGVAAVAIGICDPGYSGSNIRAVVASSPSSGNNFAAVIEDGGIWVNGSNVGNQPGTVTSGGFMRIYWDGAGGVAFSQQTGATPHWNGNVALTDTTILAGGRFSTGLTNAVLFIAPDGGAAQTWSCYASVTNCVGALLSGASYLPANAFLSIVSLQSTTGGTTSISWTATNAALSTGGLDAIIDGGSPATCGGGVIGTAGTATIAGSGSDGFHTLAIIENGLPLDESVLENYYSGTKPSGAGTIVGSFTILATSNAPTTITLAGGPYNKIYLSAGYEIVNPGIGIGEAGITVEDASNANNLTVSFDPTVTPTDSVQVECGPSGIPPTSGPGTVTLTASYAQIDGFFDASTTVSSTVAGTGTRTIGGANTSIWNPLDWTVPAPENIFDHVVIQPEATFGTVLIGGVFWISAAPSVLDVGYSGFVG